MNNTNRGYVTTLNSIYSAYRDVNPNFVSTPFLANHDMDRIASTAYGDEESMRMAAEMLLVLPGNPILYYGEELGMYGIKASGPDVWDETRRLPFLWGDEFTSDWLSSANSTLIQMNNLNGNVFTATEQLEDPTSLLNLYRAILSVRNNNIALKYGNSFVAFEGNSASIQGFYREYEYEEYHQKLLIIHNFGTVASAEMTFNGTVIYLSNVTDLANITSIPAKSTIIIDVTEAQPNA
jgi:glycosidase